MSHNPLYQSDIHSLPLVHRGKVRDIYAVGESQLLIITTDRLSAFDVILDDPIPNKGLYLTQLSNFWFQKTANIIPNQLADHASFDALLNTLSANEQAQIKDRSILVKRLKALPIEAIVRGYLIGSGWQDYQKTGNICSIQLPVGLQLAEKLPEILYTPSSKADVGQHDENISFDDSVDLLGEKIANQVKKVSIALYQQAAEYALKRGIIIADTKFEFGLDDDQQLVLIDEVLTSDSSRFWDLKHYQVGTSPMSFDKQYVRDYLQTLDWNKQSPAPKLPQHIIDKTAEKYQHALEILTNSFTI